MNDQDRAVLRRRSEARLPRNAASLPFWTRSTAPRTALGPSALLVVALGWLGLAGPALAVDGVIEINQAKAMAGGVTTGDTAGFPVSITEPGSDRLTGDLTTSVNQSAINISSPFADSRDRASSRTTALSSSA